MRCRIPSEDSPSFFRDSKEMEQTFWPCSLTKIVVFYKKIMIRYNCNKEKLLQD